MRIPIPAFALLALLAAAALAQDKSAPNIPPGVIYEKDIEFGKGGDTTLHLDLARPEKSDKPVLNPMDLD